MRFLRSLRFQLFLRIALAALLPVFVVAFYSFFFFHDSGQGDHGPSFRALLDFFSPFITGVVTAVFLALIAALAISGRVSRHLAHLSRSASLVANGVYAEPIERQRYDEFEALAESFRRMVAKIEEREQTFTALARQVSGTAGENWHQTLARLACEITGGDGAFIGMSLADQKLQLLGFVLDGNVIEPFTFDIKGTPSEHLSASGLSVFPKNLSQIFPEDSDLGFYKIEGYLGTALRDASGRTLGALAVLSHRELRPSESQINAFQILASRAEAELVRIKSDLEKKSLEEQLQHAQKMEAIGRLAGGVAHDFNNILTGIIGYTDLLLSETDPESARYGDIKEVLDAAERAVALTRQLLVFSRKQVTNPQIIDLNSTISKSQKILQRIIGEDITLEFKEGRDLWPIFMDPGQVDQVLFNLVVNSRDAMPKGGRLQIETANLEIEKGWRLTFPNVTPGPYVLLNVSDTGTGIPEEALPNIFEPFFSTKAEGKGTGLGLATVYGIIAQGSGSIDVTTESGRGTTFHILLPSAQQPSQDVPVVTPVREKKSEPGILLVDDEPFVLDFAAKILRSKGYRVFKAVNGKDALALLNENGYAVDLILTDVLMPQMTGVELAEIVRRKNPYIKVIFMSGYTGDDLQGSNQLGEGETLLSKPFSIKSLTDSIKLALAI